jgi:uncharacterized protein
MIPHALREQLERLLRETLGEWPPAWQGFHWPGYTFEHTWRVRRLAGRLARAEGADPDVVDLAALLHDLAKPQGDDHARAGAEQARRLLAGRLADGQAERVARAIEAHNAHDPADPVECRVLTDADLIDANFGLVAATRYLTIRGSRGQSLEDILADIASWQARHPPMLGRLVSAAGRACAQERLAAMDAFCASLRTDAAARALARFFIAQSARPSLSRQAERIAARGVPGAPAAAVQPFAARLRSEMDGELWRRVERSR